MRILITGAGFIGLKVAEHLHESGHDVTLLTRTVTKNVEVRQVKFDLLVDELPKQLAGRWQNQDAIVHTAASLTPRNQTKTHRDNVKMTYRALELGRKLGVDYFLLLSGASLYDFSQGGLIDEHSPLGPLDLYLKSKRDSEKIVFANRGFRSAVARVSAPIGIGAPVTRLFSTLALNSSNKKESILTNPFRLQDYIDVYDIAEGVRLLVESANKGIHNLCSGETVSDFDLATRIYRSSGALENLVKAHSGPSRDRLWKINPSPALSRGGFRVTVSIEESAGRFLNNLRGEFD